MPNSKPRNGKPKTAKSRPRLDCGRLDAVAAEKGDSTRRAIATRARIEPSTLSRLYGGTAVPSVSTLVALRDAYQLDTIDELLAGIPTPRAAA
ncbi:helix-turn-helix domain-containing protein [Kitasatospora sp. NPDC058046]|uniref:helix-turn-helix domain-containing protein n=1 Tax=Kitasatospora sp. NPDC058046 TaxID=3346312 RepID=UPI0036DC4E05